MSNFLYIDGEQVDLDNEIPMPISYSVGDFKNPENRRRSVSKTITVQGTQRNKRIFASAYNLSLTNEIGSLGFDFNPNTKVSARYFRKGVVIFEGLVRLLNVKIDNGAYSFEIVLFSDIVNIIKQMNDINVSELDWSEYNHKLTVANVSNSWATSVKVLGVDVPNYSGTGKPLGFGYWYPVIDYAYNNRNLMQIGIDNLIPYVYVKETFEKCFANIGYTLDSDFLNEDMIKALTWGFGGGEKENITPPDAIDRQVNYLFDATLVNSINGFSTIGTSSIVQNTYTLQNFNPTNIQDSYLQFDSSTGNITCMRTGRYNLKLNFNTLVSYNITSGTASGWSTIKTEVRKNGVKIGIAGSYYSISNTPTTYSLNADTVMDLDAGDIVTVQYVINNNFNSASPFTYETTIDLNSAFTLNLTSTQEAYMFNRFFGINRFIPKMKSGEFVKGIINMFNLYVSEPDIDGVIKVEPLSSFYQGEENWTDLLDHSKEINIKPSVNDSAKKFAFKFTKDDDVFNKEYFDDYGVRFGDYTYTSDNEYNTKETVFQLPFAQTITGIVGTDSRYVLPNISQVKNGVPEPYKGKPRIFFNNGLKPVTGWKINIGTFATPIFSSVYTSYPQAHHSYGDIKNPTFDLNFGKPEYLKYFFNNYSNNNLFNKYQRINILEQTSIDGKILKAYFNLESEELLDFRKLVNINGVLYRKNLIDNFDANGYETTKVELYKVLETTEIAIPQPAISTGIPNRVNVGIISSPTKVGEGSPILSGGRNSTLRDNTKYFTIYERV